MTILAQRDDPRGTDVCGGERPQGGAFLRYHPARGNGQRRESVPRCLRDAPTANEDISRVGVRLEVEPIQGRRPFGRRHDDRHPALRAHEAVVLDDALLGEEHLLRFRPVALVG